MPSPSPRHDQIKVHLTVLGRDHEVEARVRAGASRPVELLPFARRVTDVITAAGVRDVEAEGRAVSCRVGCASCCRHVVPVAPVEALAVSKLVKSLPAKQREAVRRRFAAAVRKLEELSLVDAHAPRGRTALTATPTRERSAWDVASATYFNAGVTCPFLESERCIVYAERPVACRQHLVTSPPEKCREIESSEIEATPRPVWMSELLAELSASIADVEPRAMPLVLALEWAEVHGAALEGDVPGEELVRDLVDRVNTAAE